MRRRAPEGSKSTQVLPYYCSNYLDKFDFDIMEHELGDIKELVARTLDRKKVLPRLRVG